MVNESSFPGPLFTKILEPIPAKTIATNTIQKAIIPFFIVTIITYWSTSSEEFEWRHVDSKLLIQCANGHK